MAQEVLSVARRLTLGCELSCTTIQGDTFRGTLVAQDDDAMLLAIKEAPAEAIPTTNTNQSIHIMNLRHVAKLEVTFEPLTTPTACTKLPQLDVERIRKRLEANTSAKWKEIRSRGVDVSSLAQQLFDYISKMYNDIDWDKDVIVVLGDVRISPPYSPDNCTGSQSACNRIKKQVAKFHKESLKEVL